MTRTPKRRWWQFSLRTFLVAAFVVGPIVGFLGPSIWQAIRQWNPPSRVDRSLPTLPSTFEASDTDGYYESGETPLY